MGGMGASAPPPYQAQQQQQQGAASTVRSGDFRSLATNPGAMFPVFGQISQKARDIAGQYGLDPNNRDAFGMAFNYAFNQNLNDRLQQLGYNELPEIASGALPDPHGVLGGRSAAFNAADPYGRNEPQVTPGFGSSGEGWSGIGFRQTPYGRMMDAQESLQRMAGQNVTPRTNPMMGQMPTQSAINPGTRQMQNYYQWNLPNAQPNQFGFTRTWLSPQGYATGMPFRYDPNNVSRQQFGPFVPGR